MIVRTEDYLVAWQRAWANYHVLLENERGRFRTISEIVGMLNDAGFTKPRYVNIGEQDVSFVIGR